MKPHIVVGGRIYYQTGCRECGRGFNFSLFHNGKEFYLKCCCGHIVRIDNCNTVKKPDHKPIGLRNTI